jgi:hypothetical protein
METKEKVTENVGGYSKGPGTIALAVGDERGKKND